MRHTEILPRCGQDKTGKQCNPRPKEKIRHKKNNKDCRKGKEGGRDPRRFIRNAKCLEREGQKNIIERRLLKERLRLSVGTAQLPLRAISRPISATLGSSGDHSP